MIKIAIVEDEPSESDKLREYIDRYCAENECAAQTEVFSNPNAFLQKFRCNYNLILLDIEMPELDGLSLAGRIRESDGIVPIVFVTNMKKLAIGGYKVNALDFIVKPVSYYGFALTFKKALSYISHFGEQQITIPIKFGERRVNVSDIKYVQTSARKLIFHMVNEEIVAFGTMRDLEERLRSCNFSRCNSCYLVNLRHVSKIYRDDVYVGEEQLAISRSKKKSFLDDITNYWGQH